MDDSRDRQKALLALLLVHDFDTDQSGGLSLDEFIPLVSIMSKRDKPTGASSALDTMYKAFFALADADNDSDVTADEFIAIGDFNFDDDKPPPPTMFDLDQDGYVSAEELYTLTVDSGALADDAPDNAAASFTMEAAQYLVHASDTDEDGVLSYEEFDAMMAAQSTQ
mmetsp:Transcript_13139/g.35082  ORF Transcript_13139/g.35082 Transcript_13139/m.35082 type:complete len:167 (-) Transcript_13139:211-711(-)